MNNSPAIRAAGTKTSKEREKQKIIKGDTHTKKKSVREESCERQADKA